MYYSISEKFTDTPGARTRKEGKYSGQAFYEDVLNGLYTKATETNEKLEIDLDNLYGGVPSFYSEAFGRLYAERGGEKIWDIIEFKCTDDASMSEWIKELARKGYEKAE